MDLLQWIERQSLQFALPLPPGLTRQQQQKIDKLLRLEWVQSEVWQKMQSMDFSMASKVKLLGWLMKGTVINLPESCLSPCVDIGRQIGQTHSGERL